MGAMKKPRVKRLIALLTVVAALVAAVYFGRRHLAGSAHRINPYTAMMVRLGMTQAEVESVFGAPPGDYSSGPAADQAPPENRRPDLRREAWTAEEGGAVVYFGPDEKVADFTLWVAPVRQTSKLEPLRKWWYWLTVW
jgi:hypothetical protein